MLTELTEHCVDVCIKRHNILVRFLYFCCAFPLAKKYPKTYTKMVPEYLYETVEPDNSVLLQNGSHGQADRQTGKKIISRIH